MGEQKWYLFCLTSSGSSCREIRIVRIGARLASIKPKTCQAMSPLRRIPLITWWVSFFKILYFFFKFKSLPYVKWKQMSHSCPKSQKHQSTWCFSPRHLEYRTLWILCRIVQYTDGSYTFQLFVELSLSCQFRNFQYFGTEYSKNWNIQLFDILWDHYSKVKVHGVTMLFLLLVIPIQKVLDTS